jgi:hypothetical protein
LVPKIRLWEPGIRKKCQVEENWCQPLIMKIRDKLLTEHSKANALKIADYIGDETAKFGELMNIFFNEEYRLSQRAAYVFMISVDRHPSLIKPYMNKLLSQLSRKDIHNSVRRNIVRALQFVEIPKKLEGRIFSICVDLMEDIREPIAIRAFALTVATKIGKNEPDLINELCLIVDAYMRDPSPGLQVRIKKLFLHKESQ